MNVQHLELTDSQPVKINVPETERNIPTTREVLEELFQLLEDYAPAWYTEQHHNRAVAALLGRPI